VAAFLQNPEVSYVELVDPPSFIPETMPAIQLLRSFLARPQGLAYVVDEHGGLEGIVTLNDLVEEILSDALPLQERQLYIEAVGERRWLASGLARLEDLADEMDIRVEIEEGIETVGGLLFHRLGQIPAVGITVELEGYWVSVRRVARRRVEEVLVEKFADLLGDDSSEPLPGLTPKRQ
jgi:CBS domain containing-hemolysin-like protein